MIWLIEFALILGGVTLFVTLASKWGKASNHERISKRIKAYRETIRRTGAPSNLNAMNDTELHDILETASHRLMRHRSNRVALLTVSGFATLIIAVFLGANAGIQSFAIAGAMGLVTSYGIARAMDNHLQQWTSRQELDADRLIFN